MSLFFVSFFFIKRAFFTEMLCVFVYNLWILNDLFQCSSFGRSYFDLGFGKRAPRFVVKTDGKIKGASSTTVRVYVFAIST